MALSTNCVDTGYDNDDDDDDDDYFKASWWELDACGPCKPTNCDAGGYMTMIVAYDPWCKPGNQCPFNKL